MIRILVFVLICASAVRAFSQNLLGNGGFEKYNRCPGTYIPYGERLPIPDWTAATLGTPDYFHSCSRGEAGVPHNWAGIAEAIEGEGYVGIYAYRQSKPYREYLQSRLLLPMLKDSLYTIYFRYKLSSYSMFSINRIGAHLSANAISGMHDQVIDIRPTFEFVKDSAMDYASGAWEIAQVTYQARGGEQYLTIGNFSPDSLLETHRMEFSGAQQPMLTDGSYYYIDDVRVAGQAPEPEPFLAYDQFARGDVFVLRNVQFAYNSIKLSIAAKEELDLVIVYLRRNNQVHLDITGHTDDVGSDAFNRTLSRRRAETVAAYLISRGIARERIEYFGAGKSRPLSTDDSDLARSMNRRVEVKFR